MKRVWLLALGCVSVAIASAEEPRAVAPREVIEPPPLLTGRGDYLFVELAADSWLELREKARPDFTWNRYDMLWIDTDAQGKPSFRLNCAYRYAEETEKPRWVLMGTRKNGGADERLRELGGRNLKGVARLHPARPTSDHGSGDYAIVLAENERVGTVYEVGWQKLMANGTSHAELERRLYLVKERSGNWIFLGEAPEETSGKLGSYRGYFTRVTPRVAWEQAQDAPCRVDFLIEHDDYALPSDAEAVKNLRPDLILYEEMTLDGASRQPRRVTTRPYLRIEPGDNLNSVVERLSAWTLGWESGSEKERQRIRTMWQDALVRLNPGVDLKKLKPGTTLQVLTYGETVKLLRSEVEPPVSPK